MKDYLITFVRLLLGIDQAVGSGHLSCVSTYLHKERNIAFFFFFFFVIENAEVLLLTLT